MVVVLTVNEIDCGNILKQSFLVNRILKMKLTQQTIKFMLETKYPAIIGPYANNRVIQSRICAYNKKHNTSVKVTQNKVFVTNMNGRLKIMWEVRLR